MGSNYQNTSASGNARQHNGNVYNQKASYYTLKQKRSDETLRAHGLNRRMLKAAAEGQTQRVQYLINIGADIDFSDDDDMTALHHAALSGFEDTVETLIKAGSDVNYCSPTRGTPLGLAAAKARKNVVKYLLASTRADVNADCGWFGSPLHAACSSGDFDTVQSLLDYKASLDAARIVQENSVLKLQGKHLATDRYYYSHWGALGIAIIFGDLAMFDFLISKGADFNARHRRWSTLNPTGDQATLKEEVIYSQVTYLMGAAARCRTEIVQRLISCRCELDARDSDRMAALMYAAYCPDESCLRALINAGCGLDIQDEDGRTAMMYAARRNRSDAVSVLIQSGANRNLQDVDGWTALMYAAQEGNKKIAWLLVEARADMTLRSKEHRTALDIAILEDKTECADYLSSMMKRIGVLQEVSGKSNANGTAA